MGRIGKNPSLKMPLQTFIMGSGSRLGLNSEGQQSTWSSIHREILLPIRIKIKCASFNMRGRGRSSTCGSVARALQGRLVLQAAAES